ncbi:MAG: TRAP transporter substrate-binding protein DctP, partial [Caldimonas sp.]
MIQRRTLAAHAAAWFFAAVLGSAAGSASAQSLTLKAADVHPPGYPNVVAIEHMGDKLEKASNGRIKLKMFPGGVLGGEKEMIEQTQVGAIDI